VSARVSVARQVLKATAAAADVLRAPPPGLVVLIYHRVGRQAPIEIDLPLATFREQIAFLAAHATVTTLSEALARLGDPDAPREPLVAVTFDDGTADFADVAMPVLVEHRVPVTLYVATAFLETGRPFPNGGTPLSWGALRDAVTTGLVDVGSHTHSHALLDRVPPEQIDDELDRSIGLIGERVGVTAEHFAYPKAVPGSQAATMAVHARFRSAALAGTRVNRYGATDRYRLARSPIQTSDGMRWFRAKVGGGMALEDSLRQTINRRRYASGTS
jgi:peptidoglycan/xylan/chitin deacetylase (PgdA/CDA1 family)